MRNLPRVYTSFMPNAPVITGVPGAFLDILKKCLIGGWTPFDVQSIVVSGGIGYITYNNPEASLPDYCILNITGCAEPLLNKEHVIYNGTDTRGYFKTDVADGTYGGAIKANPAPAGWDLMFSGTNQAIIRSGNEDSSRVVVQITDTTATTTGFNFAVDATSVTALIDEVKTIINYPWNVCKSRNADASNLRGWSIICDNTTVFFVIDLFSFGGGVPLKRDGLQRGRMHFFGDYISNDKTDTESFAAYFQALPDGATDNNQSSSSGSPHYSGIWTEDWNHSRPLVKSSLFRYNRWNWANFNAAPDVINQTYRVSGSTSNFTTAFNTNLERSYKELGVYCRIGGPSTQISILGSLPGIRYSDYFIRPLFRPFGSSQDPDTGEAYVYIPVSWATVTNNNYEISMGFSPFRMGKRWDE